MPPAKPHITKTHGPIHFEDLDPHRFEDLVRELVYDYKDWQKIEATGRSGNDAGFDIRAYEKGVATTPTESDEEEESAPTSAEGNVWMVQVKREATIGPKRVQEIVGEINLDDPPYGYILAAPTNFSRTSYDAFREGLRAKGVMEFHLWGRAELEDMLHFPKNDRILFTFFGISLATKRRSRTTDVRSMIATKNKLYRAVGEGWHLSRQVLLRDVNDTHYPYTGNYHDFDDRPRWKEYTVVGHHPVGIWLNRRQFYAYVDLLKKEFDFTEVIDMRHRDVVTDEERDADAAKQQSVLGFWEFLPRAARGKFVVDALIAYRDVLAVDEKGDVYYSCPHVFIDFESPNVYADQQERFELGDEKIPVTAEYKRMKIFPETMPAAKPGRLRKGKEVLLDDKSLKEFNEYREIGTLYDIGKKYAYLKVGDVVAVGGSTSGKAYIQITHIGRMAMTDYLAYTREKHRYHRAILQQVGPEIGDTDELSFFEFKRYYGSELRDKD